MRLFVEGIDDHLRDIGNLDTKSNPRSVLNSLETARLTLLELEQFNCSEPTTVNSKGTDTRLNKSKWLRAGILIVVAKDRIRSAKVALDFNLSIRTL